MLNRIKRNGIKIWLYAETSEYLTLLPIYFVFPKRFYIMKNKNKIMGSENVMSADNQQERLDFNWIVGFVDGEGCFHVAINKLPKMTLGWQVLPEFRIVQHQRDEKVLLKLKEFFGFGNVVINHGDRKEFRVRGLENLNIIVQFFKQNTLQTSKQKSFELFAEVIELMNKKEHLNKDELNKIAKLASQMNRQVKRNLESSETIRQNSFNE